MSKIRKIFVVVGLIILLGFAVAFVYRDWLVPWFFRQTDSSVEEGRGSNVGEIEVAADNLTVPWEIVLLPDGDMLVSERPGTIRRIGQDQRSYEVAGVQHRGEGGLLGMALHPRFEENRWLYLYMTTQANESLINRVERYVYQSGELGEREVIIDNIPGAAIHDGGRIAFGPDKLLYITTGDAAAPQLAQDINSLAGKILRVNDNGGVPDDNPFNNAVYSYGHRNPQGLAWDDQGRLWSTEHGQTSYDELNLIERGVNYGWPEIEGDETKEGMRTPVAHSGATETWAPGGLAFVDGSLYFAGLRGRALYQAAVNDDGSADVIAAHFRAEYGRLRAVVLGPGNNLYISTSNTDGRGAASPEDDRILRIETSIFQ